MAGAYDGYGPDDRGDCNLFFKALDMIQDEVYLIKLPEGIEYCNRAARRFFTLSFAHQQSCLNLKEAEKYDVHLMPIVNLVKRDRSERSIIYETPRGRRLVMKGVLLESEGPGRVIVTIHDITQIDLMQSQLDMIEKMEKNRQNELNRLRQKNLEKKEFIFASKPMEQIMDLISRIAQVDSNIIILGESGTGKEVLARTIHDMSLRYMGPFVKIDCGSIPENLIESELFGYEEGAFTGARKQGKSGMIQLADKGTLFLDEIGELQLSLQVKLLQVLQERRLRKVGGTKTIPVDIRVIVATNRNLAEMVAQGAFRQDLYYRLNVVPIQIPPLRQRTEEIAKLTEYFLARLQEKYRRNKMVSPEVMRAFMNYSWPGNVRELENMVERLFVTSGGFVIKFDELPDYVKMETKEGHDGLPDVAVNHIVPLRQALEKVEAGLIDLAVREYKTTVKVGEVLGIDQSTAARKMRKYRISYVK